VIVPLPLTQPRPRPELVGAELEFDRCSAGSAVCGTCAS
jgi:hypothetical protein